MLNKNKTVQTEACFVISNVISSADVESLLSFWNDYKDEFVQGMAVYMREYKVSIANFERVVA